MVVVARNEGREADQAATGQQRKDKVLIADERPSLMRAAAARNNISCWSMSMLNTAVGM